MHPPCRPCEALQWAQQCLDAQEGAQHAVLCTPASTALETQCDMEDPHQGVCMDLQATAQLDEVIDRVAERLQQASRAQRCSTLQCLHLLEHPVLRA